MKNSPDYVPERMDGLYQTIKIDLFYRAFGHPERVVDVTGPKDFKEKLLFGARARMDWS